MYIKFQWFITRVNYLDKSYCCSGPQVDIKVPNRSAVIFKYCYKTFVTVVYKMNANRRGDIGPPGLIFPKLLKYFRLPAGLYCNM